MLDFLDLPEDNRFAEKDLEQAINHLIGPRSWDKRFNLCAHFILIRRCTRKKPLVIMGIDLPQELPRAPVFIGSLIHVELTLFRAYLEQAIIDRLQLFLLELGKGFSFVARQKRISDGEEDHFIDLVFAASTSLASSSSEGR